MISLQNLLIDLFRIVAFKVFRSRKRAFAKNQVSSPIVNGVWGSETTLKSLTRGYEILLQASVFSAKTAPFFFNLTSSERCLVLLPSINFDTARAFSRTDISTLYLGLEFSLRHQNINKIYQHS